MALDTATKRRSMFAMGLVALVIHPVPDGTIAAIDQKHFLGLPAAVATNMGIATDDLHVLHTGPLEPNHVSDSGANLLLGNELEAQGGAFFGGATTYMQTEADADTFWVGEGTGLPYGHMYVDGTQVIRVAITINTPAEVEGDGTGGTATAEDGWLGGDLNLITFPTGGTEHYITVTKPGVYHINWNLSFKMVTGAANTQVHGGLAVDGTAIRNKCEAHRTISNNTDTGNMAGSCIVDLPNGTEELSVWMENSTNSNDADVSHGSLVAVMVGGT